MIIYMKREIQTTEYRLWRCIQMKLYSQRILINLAIPLGKTNIVFHAFSFPGVNRVRSGLYINMLILLT